MTLQLISVGLGCILLGLWIGFALGCNLAKKAILSLRDQANHYLQAAVNIQIELDNLKESGRPPTIIAGWQPKTGQDE